MKYPFRKVFLIMLVYVFSLTQFLFSQGIKQEVKSDIFDTGKMWTFDFPPTEYLKETYDFEPTEDWFENVRLSALRIPGCTASFVSEDGLMMTNNHCSTWHRNNVQKEGENLEETGFYAENLEDERKVPNMFAEQLVLIVDVTNEINEAVNSGTTDEEKIDNKKSKAEELVKRYKEETGLNCQFVSLFNGGKFSVYGYKRFNDVRFVFEPEEAIASFGGDEDNFTYPRYDLDVTFFRVYDDDGNPLKTENYFKFNLDGVQKDEVMFSVGNPGSTQRLKTVAQLEYARDVSSRNRNFMLDGYYNLLEELKQKYPERSDEFERIRRRIGNGQKVSFYTQQGFLNPYLIARKQDFENNLRSKVSANKELNEKYGHIWDAIKNLREEFKPIDQKLAVYRLTRFLGSEYFNIAKNIVEFANQIKLPIEERLPKYKDGNLDSLKNTIFPKDFDEVLEMAKLQVQLDYFRLNLGDDNEIVKELAGNLKGEQAVKVLIQKSFLKNKQSADELLAKSADEILNSDDPFIYFILNTQNKIDALAKRSKEITDTESVLEDMLGKILFEVYGTSIPPDANFTLRLSDGVLKTFDYNGTKAIEKTTFYGMYNRYYGANKEYPWNLPLRWAEPPADLDLSTEYNFISTSDIVGGNSGSAVINKNAEAVGLAFDGNVPSIIGNFIYLPEDNRMVSVAAKGIYEALDKVYKAKRISEELKTGKMVK